MPSAFNLLTKTLVAAGLAAVVVGCASHKTVSGDPWGESFESLESMTRPGLRSVQSEPAPVAQVGHMETIQSDSVQNAVVVEELDDGNSTATSGLPDPSLQREVDPGGTQERLPIDYSNALATAVGMNPEVSFASSVVREAYASELEARSRWLPSIRLGLSFYNHNGVLQNAAGDVFNVNRGTIFSGLGSRAVGSGTPSVPGMYSSFHLVDMIYEPQIAAKARAAKSDQAAATMKNVALATSLAYLKLLKEHQSISIARQHEADAQELVRLTSNFAKVGQGPQSDADRAGTELTFAQTGVVTAQERIDVANARLLQYLSLGGNPKLEPAERQLVPIELVASDRSLDDLLQTGIRHRRELRGTQNAVAAACDRVKREATAPVLPSVTLAASYGGFGGGTNGDFAGNYDDRFDFDAFVYWNLRNLGAGERSARMAANAKLNQARSAQESMMDQISREIAEAHAKTKARSKNIETARQGIESAQNAYDRDLQRIRQGEGLPIEALSSLRALDEARRGYLDAIADHNEAQFILMHAIGWPGEASLPVGDSDNIEPMISTVRAIPADFDAQSLSAR